MKILFITLPIVFISLNLWSFNFSIEDKARKILVLHKSLEDDIKINLILDPNDVKYISEVEKSLENNGTLSDYNYFSQKGILGRLVFDILKETKIANVTDQLSDLLTSVKPTSRYVNYVEVANDSFFTSKGLCSGCMVRLSFDYLPLSESPNINGIDPTSLLGVFTLSVIGFDGRLKNGMVIQDITGPKSYFYIKRSGEILTTRGTDNNYYVYGHRLYSIEKLLEK